MRRDGTENGRGEGGKEKRKRDEESTRRELREEEGDAENVEGKKKRRERGRGREENEEETAMHTLPSRETTGDDGKNGDGGQLRKRDRREEERKECICGLLDRVGGRVRRLGRALRWWEPRPRECIQAGQPGADLDRRNVRTNGNSAYTYYRIHCREREREKERELTP